MFVPTRPAGLLDVRGASESGRNAERILAQRARGPLDVWHEVGAAGEPAWAANWANYAPGGGFPALAAPYSNVAFMKDHRGFVHLRGIPQRTPPLGTATLDTMFTLGPNYRPRDRELVWGNALGSSLALVYFEQDGRVRFSAPNVSAFSLEGVEYRTNG